VSQVRIPYGRQHIDEDDIAAVCDVLRGDWLTTGPSVQAFEKAFAAACGAAEAVAVNSGTAALHAAMQALGIEAGDEVIVPALTFAATANCVVYQGGIPVFADVDPETLLLDPAELERLVNPRTRAVICVDYAGQPCDYAELLAWTRSRGLPLVADACHALGAHYQGRPVGSLATLSTFSLHPVKPITSGEGGVITTDDAQLAQRMRIFRNHGITTDFRQREEKGSWFYELDELGYNYRLCDIGCALASSQLRKLESFTAARQAIAARYDEAFSGMTVRPLARKADRDHAYHLYVVRVEQRARVFQRLREKGIGVNVHYVPVHLHPFYRRQFGTRVGQCPVTEAAYEEILSLPVFPTLSAEAQDEVIEALGEVLPA